MVPSKARAFYGEAGMRHLFQIPVLRTMNCAGHGLGFRGLRV